MCLKAAAQLQRARVAGNLHLGLVSETDQAVSPKEEDERGDIHYLRICPHKLDVKHET